MCLQETKHYYQYEILFRIIYITCKEKTSYCEKLLQLYKRVCVYRKQNTITNMKFYLGSLKYELDYS